MYQISAFEKKLMELAMWQYINPSFNEAEKDYLEKMRDRSPKPSAVTEGDISRAFIMVIESGL